MSFVPTGPSVYAQSSPTGNPLDTFHAQYLKTPLTATIGGSDLPVLQFTAFAWLGTQGSTSAQPTWTWKSTSAPASLLKYSITANGNVVVGPLTISASSTSVGLTSLYPTIPGYLYGLTLVASNGSGSATFTGTPGYNSDATATFSSFSWAGGIGTTSAQPTWVWTISGTNTSVPDTLTYKLYQNSTLLVSGSLPAGYGYTPPTTTYTYNGTTLLNGIYQLVLYCNGVQSFTNSETNTSSLTVPRITPSSFNFASTLGGPAAAPTWTWTLSGGTPDTMTVNLYGDSSTTPTTLLDTRSSYLITNYVYNGTTVGNYYYKIVVSASNAAGSATPYMDTECNTLTQQPFVNLSGDQFNGSSGTTYAQPSWTWTYGGGPPASYAWILYIDPAYPLTLNPSTIADSGTSAITSYTYNGSTIPTYSYGFVVTATNPLGSDNGNGPWVLQNYAPVTASITSSIGTGTSAMPSATVTSSNATSIRFRLYQSKTTTNPGSSLSACTLIGSYNNLSPTGNDTYAFSNTTIIGRWYIINCLVSGQNGSVVVQSTSMLCSAS